MLAIVLKFILFLNASLTILYPWIGIVVYYIFAVLVPQDIWFWAFQGIRPILLLAAPLGIITSVKIVLGNINFDAIKTKLSFLFLILWLLNSISYFFGPYVHVKNEYTFFDSGVVFGNINKSFLIVIFSFFLIDTLKKAKFLWSVGVLTSAVMIYWMNMQYITGAQYGRLHGPGQIFGGIYYDQNSFAALLVVTLPFLYYSCFLIKKHILRYPIWVFVVLGWHAVFLTGSRGGLIALACSILVATIRSNQKIFKIFIIPIFLVIFLWQGGNVMLSRTSSIENYHQDDSAMGRLEAWSAAIKMADANPLTGVGVGSFGQAFPSFSTSTPRIAHNTFFQLIGECGWAAGFTYLGMVFLSLKILWPIHNTHPIVSSADKNIFFIINESCLVGLVGFFVNSLFLSLEAYEYFYYLIILTNFIFIYKKNTTPPEKRMVKT